MTYRQQLWEVALDQHGLVTARNATELGIPRIEPLVKLAHRGQLTRVGHGIPSSSPWYSRGRSRTLHAGHLVGWRATAY